MTHSPDSPTNNESNNSRTHAERVVPMHHELGPMLYADAIESLRMAEGDLGIFISQSLLLASRPKKPVDPNAPVPDWLQ